MGGVWQLLLVGLVIALGVVGVIIPGVPGRWLVWAAMLWWSLHEQTVLAWVLLVASTALLLVVQVILWLMPTRRIRDSGATGGMAAVAGAGAIVGFFVVPVLGAIPGFIGGIYGYERHRLGGHGQAVASTRTVMRAAGTSVLVELFACLLIAGAWLGAVLWG
ncbi:DUF456 domain-containing protein [Streptomyces sp. NPDC051018]|uniref:DUF456 domain-containing protein n=1 Tax=Streptomyces sp. NPDC051018 TaxID=3365639 RepID=UPI0037B5361D